MKTKYNHQMQDDKIQDDKIQDKMPLLDMPAVKQHSKTSLFLSLSCVILAASAIAALSTISPSTYDTDKMAFAHSMFNSAEKFMAGYRVQVATAPEFPQINEPSMFLIRVTDTNFEEVDRFTMGIRFFFNNKQIDTIPPTSVEGGHWDFTHVWRNQGNHIVKVDLYDMIDKPGVTTFTFNMGTQSPFGYIFVVAITVGAICFAGVMMYIYLPKLLKGKRQDNRHSFDV